MEPPSFGIASVMANSEDRTWTAHIVISFSDPMLNVYGRALEDEIRHVLARLDDQKDVCAYLENEALASAMYRQAHPKLREDK